MSVRMLAFIRQLVILGMGLILLAACNDGSSEKTTPNAVPTRTLIPATPTLTPEPSTLTPTPTDLPAPSSLSPVATEVSIPVIPPVAQAFIDRTQGDLSAQQDVDPADIRLLSLEKFTWHDESWGCATRHDAEDTQTITTRGYRIVFSAGSHIYVYHTDSSDTFFLCEDRDWLALEGEPLPVDPIAQSMVELTARDVAGRLDVPETHIKLVSLLAVDWPETSMGCPKPGGDYEDRLTRGYRIVFRVEDETIIYHTSIRHFVRCTPDEEILPGLLRQAMPTPEPTATE